MKKYYESHIWDEDFFKISSVKYRHRNWKNPEPILLDFNSFTPIIVGENGTGKTALFQILLRFSRDYKQLKGEKLEDFKNKLGEKGITFLEIKYHIKNFNRSQLELESFDYSEIELMCLGLHLTGISRFENIDNEIRCSLYSELRCTLESALLTPEEFFNLGNDDGHSLELFPPAGNVQTTPNHDIESTIISQHKNQITYSFDTMRNFLEKALRECKSEMIQKYGNYKIFMSKSEKEIDEMFKLPKDETLVKCPEMQTIKLFEARKADLPGDGDYSSLASENHHGYERIILGLNDEEFHEKFSIRKNTGQIYGHRRSLKKMDHTLKGTEECYGKGEVYYFDSHEIFKDLAYYKLTTPHIFEEENPLRQEGRFTTTFLARTLDYPEERIFYCATELKELIELLKEEFFRIPEMVRSSIVSLVWGIPLAKCVGLRFTERLSEHYAPGGYMTDGQKRLYSIAEFCAGIALSRGKVIGLIDEPEASLHLDWQRKLITELQTITGSHNQVIIATHSPDIVINHIDRVIEFNSILNA